MSTEEAARLSDLDERGRAAGAPADSFYACCCTCRLHVACSRTWWLCLCSSRLIGAELGQMVGKAEAMLADVQEALRLISSHAVEADTM